MKGKCGNCGREGLPDWTYTPYGVVDFTNIYTLEVTCPVCQAGTKLLTSPCASEIACAMYALVKLPAPKYFAVEALKEISDE